MIAAGLGITTWLARGLGREKPIRLVETGTSSWVRVAGWLLSSGAVAAAIVAVVAGAATSGDLIVFWGANVIASNLHLWSRAQEAKRHGARLIAIDPYRSLTAEKCHQHIALLPGTDGAFAFGVMHVLVREGWLDRDYIERYTLGFEALATRAREFDPRRVAEICGISPAEI